MFIFLTVFVFLFVFYVYVSWCVFFVIVFFFFFKQKTAYEMRISDWSSDVCSSDLRSRGSGHSAGDHFSAAFSGGARRFGSTGTASQWRRCASCPLKSRCAAGSVTGTFACRGAPVQA